MHNIASQAYLSVQVLFFGDKLPNAWKCTIVGVVANGC